MSARNALSESLGALISRLGGDPGETLSAPERLVALAALLDSDHTDDRLWLAWATLRGELPLEDQVIEFRRDIVLNGAAKAIGNLGDRADSSIFGLTAEIQILDDPILVDVHNTSSTSTMSGIQRVVFETTGRWARGHELVFVAWAENGKALRRLTAKEEARMRGGDPDDVPTEKPRAAQLVIPHGGTMIIPELAADDWRAVRLLAMARFARTAVAYIGFDCVPLTSGETASIGIAAHFPLYLDAVAWSNRVAAISQSTAVEFEGWKKMLPSSGRQGPDIRAVFLAGDSLEPTEEDLARARVTLKLEAGVPMVLVVGSHEPRKNHLSVLQAARQLWEKGETFRLVMIGGASWNSDAFDGFAESLKSQGRPLVIVSAASDSLLSAAYRLATVSIFTSFHEGFGLPIVESLRAGTPVIASNVGSMLELSNHYGGVITVDPHSDLELETALASALNDPTVLAAARAALATNDYRTWDAYAAETWDYLTAP